MFPQFILFLGACVTSTLAQADVNYLNDEILPRCFEHTTVSNGKLYVNGKEEPVANSMENFISLIDKFELANPDMKLDDLLFVLLKNYTAENVYYQQADKFLALWKPTLADVSQFQDMWEPNKKNGLPNHVDPFEKNEKCSLFFMLSHTVNDTARPGIDPVVSSGASSPEGAQHASVKTLKPREQGVVAVNRSKTHAVALGRVLLGLYVGLKNENERIKPLESYNRNPKIDLGSIQNVDILYLVTLADQLIISQFPLEEASAAKAGLGGNGNWESVGVAPVTKTPDFPICPAVYELPENNTSAYTFSSVRGGVDGLILGEVIRDIHSSSQNVRLSQILRMYYGRNGLQEKPDAPASKEAISFCNRISQIAPKEQILKDQMLVFLALVFQLPNYDTIYTKAKTIYDEKKENILMPSEEVSKNCRLLKESKDVPACEATVDVIFVIDTTPKSDTSDLETQQEIIGHVANHLDTGFRGSTLTVFSDQRNGTYGLSLVSIISNTTSLACAACSATQFQIDSSTAQADKDVVIQSVSEVLKNVEEEEKLLNGARGKVVIFFNFNDDEAVSYRLERALRDLYMRRVGVHFFAVGNNKDVLKTYTQGQLQNVLSVLGTLPREVADTLALKICEVPSKLQYDDCKNRRNEPNAVYEGLISSNSIQRWAMYPKYFFKSLTPKMFFQCDREIEVCHSRAYSLAENQKVHCQKTSPSGGRLEFNTTNPCRTFTDHNCAPWYFTVKFVEGNSDQGSVPNRLYCQDTNSLRCETLDQIKFKVSHEGIRCSSCSGLFSTPGLLLACFAAYILHRVMNVDV